MSETNVETLLFGKEIITPSSKAQLEIFGPSVVDPDASKAYNLSISLFFHGAIDIDILYSSLLNLIQRHEALRGHFSDDGTVFMVREQIGFAMPVLDLSDFSKLDQEKKYQVFVKSEMNTAFDLVNGPLFRATYIVHSPTESTLVFNCHHSVVDGWSLNTILTDLPDLYSTLAFELGKSDRQVPALMKPASYIEYLKTAVERETLEASRVENYWKEVFNDRIPILELPIDFQRPTARTYDAKREDYRVKRDTFNKLIETGAKHGLSQFMTLYSVFALYLHRISGQDDVIVGMPAAGQIKSGEASLIGHDARLLPIRSFLESGDTFQTFSSRLMGNFLDGYENQWMSIPRFIKILNQTLNYSPDPSRVPISQVLFNFDPGHAVERLQFGSIEATHFFNHRAYETFEWSINAVVEHQDLILETTYNTSLFKESTIHEHLELIEFLMIQLAESPEAPITNHEYLSKSARELIDRRINSTFLSYDRERCVEDLIYDQVKENPDHIAVEFGNEVLTYAQLWEYSGRVANAIEPNILHSSQPKLVGVILERNIHLVPVLLGIWRAGAAYVPLDPSYPEDRIQYMIEHSGLTTLVHQSSTRPRFCHVGKSNVSFINIDTDVSNTSPSQLSRPKRLATDIAYVIYTSGSTGRPKGVKVTQRNLHNFLKTMAQNPGINQNDRVLAVTTISFDISNLEIWLPLSVGARTVVVDRSSAIDGNALIQTIQEHRITFIQATPATWRLLLFCEWEGDKRIKALCGGEALPRELANSIRAKVSTLTNVYGPTETTVWSTLDEVTDDPVRIGKPIGNTQVYVLDPAGKRLPVGCIGELFIGGDGVSEGYLNQDEMTSERFIDNPFSNQGKIYKTGDLVRIRNISKMGSNDLSIEYIGRNDFQVKVRGFRIELGEVQFAVSKHPSIKECIVVVRNLSDETTAQIDAQTNVKPNAKPSSVALRGQSNQAGSADDNHLVVYYSLKVTSVDKSQKAKEIKESLKGNLPDYMIPTFFMELDALPLTQNGKIDVKNLPSPFRQTPKPIRLANASIRQEEYRQSINSSDWQSAALKSTSHSLQQALQSEPSKFVAFSDEEKFLIQLWSELLGLENPSAEDFEQSRSLIQKTDKFLELGGHSLLVIRATRQIEKHFAINFSPKTLITKSLEQVAASIRSLRMQSKDANEIENLDLKSNPTITRQLDKRNIPKVNSPQGQSFFFGFEMPDQDESKTYENYGILHGAEYSSNHLTSVLIIPPLGQEYMRTNWMLRTLAVQLQSNGFPTLRFDHYSHGDSHGQTEDLSTGHIISGILGACVELKERTKSQNIVVIAYRASALFASKAIKQFMNSQKIQADAIHLVTVDAPSSGFEYLSDLRTMQEARWKSYPFKKKTIQDADHEEIVGSLFSKNFIREFENVVLDEFPCSSQAISSERLLTSLLGDRALDSVPHWNDFAKIENIWLCPQINSSIVRMVTQRSSAS